MSSDRGGGFGLTPKAEADMEEIWRYTAEKWSVAQADSYIGSLAECFALIAKMPKMARERPEFSPPVRIHVHDRHLVVYVIEDGSVAILRVLGAGQDWISILNASEP